MPKGLTKRQDMTPQKQAQVEQQLITSSLQAKKAR